ncbi:phospholipase D family protein [Modestobacter sp. DSM 44400]|uniref:phospholipase D family protein n=1 Tax=Modestobacter sp. DSM 44400 TaxID=1550230 RepID=UPI00273929AE|nr:phospholipase D family protein [Modestobacter sp. DSM 44400]
MGFSAGPNRKFATQVNAAGGEVLLDQRVRALGSHHQKLVVIRRPRRSAADVAFVGGIDLAHSRRDDAAHRGDAQPRPFAAAYGATPPWHDVQLELHGPAVADAEVVFRERWNDPTAVSRAPWQVFGDVVRGADRTASPLPAALPDPPRAGSCAVQLSRTYPRRWPGYPFAPHGERSIARGYAKALSRAQRLVYIEDQYLWSTDVARVFATALRRCPQLRLIAVAPRFPDQEGTVHVPSALLGQTAALAMVRKAGGDRVQVLDLEIGDGTPVYVHAKTCIVDDVWAAVGSGNLNRRSWTHDSELTAAVLDSDRDARDPVDPAGQGDGARRFARDLRLQLLREHLDRADGDDADLVDPDDAAATVRRSAAALDGWHRDGRTGPRPPGRLRNHRAKTPPAWQRWLTAPAYATLFDPDGRPPGMKLRRTF